VAPAAPVIDGQLAYISNVCFNVVMAGTRPPGDTAQRLLDAAERLFGQQGYSAVGMRALALEAKVNLQAAAYHFGSKKALYLETFLRRFHWISSERLSLLSHAQQAAAGRPVSVEIIIDCMMRPPFELGLTHPAFSEFLARALIAPPPFLHTILRRELEPHMGVFLQALQQALPALPIPVLQLRMALAMGPLIMFIREMGRLPRRRDADREEAVLQELVRFASGGLLSAPVSLDPDHLRHLFPPKRLMKAHK